MKIATWNVNSIKARLPIVTAWLESVQPDVLLLQELKGTDFPAEAFRALGYESAAVTQKTYNGVAILSRHSIEVVSTALPPISPLDDHDSHARFLEVLIPGVLDQALRVVDIYLPNGNPVGPGTGPERFTDKFTYKLAWMERLKFQMTSWAADPTPTLIGGDWNVIPEDIDCHKPSSWAADALFQPEPRDLFRSLLALGYTDAFRALHPGATGQFTYWDYFRNAFATNRGIRIDHFLLTPSLASRLQSCEIDRTPRAQEKPSDHTPVLLTLS